MIRDQVRILYLLFLCPNPNPNHNPNPVSVPKHRGPFVGWKKSADRDK